MSILNFPNNDLSVSVVSTAIVINSDCSDLFYLFSNTLHKVFNNLDSYTLDGEVSAVKTILFIPGIIFSPEISALAIMADTFERTPATIHKRRDNIALAGFDLSSDDHKIAAVDPRAYHGFAGDPKNEVIAAAPVHEAERYGYILFYLRFDLIGSAGRDRPGIRWRKSELSRHLVDAVCVNLAVIIPDHAALIHSQENKALVQGLQYLCLQAL